jgi:hypothetical protein
VPQVSADAERSVTVTVTGGNSLPPEGAGAAPIGDA